jgi:hypothetical protein
MAPKRLCQMEIMLEATHSVYNRILFPVAHRA